MSNNQSPAWIEALKQKTPIELKDRLRYLEWVTGTFLMFYNEKRITSVNMWVDGYDKGEPGAPPPDTGYHSFNLRFEEGEVPDQFREFIHNLCTSYCAEKLVIESLVKPD
jgi:hypothetical protein